MSTTPRRAPPPPPSTPRQPPPAFCPALWDAASRGDVETLSSLLGLASSSSSPASVSASAPASPSAEVKRAINVGNPADPAGDAAIHAASRRGHIAAVELLHGAGANADRPNGEGQTALHVAAAWAKGPRSLVVDLLAGKLGADANARDAGGRTPLCCALVAGNFRAAKAIAAAGGLIPHAMWKVVSEAVSDRGQLNPFKSYVTAPEV
ncbi:hypothetical protein Pelo_14227 [Pelomyxa schiedti]|nr:hypothetical protein Pelo_14227 [Pelomyxa schiedti]